MSRILTLLAVIGAMILPVGVTTVDVAAQIAPSAVLGELEGHFEASARKLVALAEAMPASTYDWSPGEGVASVARVYMHIARYNYMYPHENMGLESPVSRESYGGWEGGVSQKEEVVEILTSSMDYVRTVFDGMAPGEVDDETRLYGRQVQQWAVLLQLVAHMNEHLGQSIAYARTNGVVPPWSR